MGVLDDFQREEGFTARWPEGGDPGERFRAMEVKKGYEAAWKLATTAEGIRPAKAMEIENWLNSHESDAVFAQSCSEGDRRVSAEVRWSVLGPSDLST